MASILLDTKQRDTSWPLVAANSGLCFRGEGAAPTELAVLPRMNNRSDRASPLVSHKCET